MSDLKVVRYIGTEPIKLTYHVSTGSKPAVIEFAVGEEKAVPVDMFAWLCGGSFPDKFFPGSEKKEAPASVVPAAKGK